MKQVLLVLTIAAATVAGAAHAERRSFTTDVSRVGAEGRGYSRHTEQVGTATGFSRQSALTTNGGKTASRAVSVDNDAAAQTRTRAVEGTRLNGNSYSGQSTTARTDDGYTRNGSYTNAAGQTATRDVDVSVDAEAQSLTKSKSVTGFNGETHSSTVVRTRTDGAE